ncbi:hypothetical protein M427DRAFT_41608 [Gonapodya prolifera JEL478]|uniref:Protein YTP1-like C-terminal domain-containing protein n=1 Tax=Gonapodya prolifera (strain JEL478) TaxID=1344416 RepID=A0A139ASI6_GONPJ|nr:hypothetical protein M427DRAFT_41608 [Gonapodya prolifera JEL478]|eukprot:KXS19701.1 hypothetical protein M427DRAFT_41608 [Gonapodya prolifera JEL478]
MGLLWFFGGALGIFLARPSASGTPRRTVVPALVVAITGWGMAGHGQFSEMSTHIHSTFGMTLVAAGVARVIEVCFVAPSPACPVGSQAHAAAATGGEGDGTEAPRAQGAKAEMSPFQYLPPLLLVASGVLFVSATDEQIRWGDAVGIDATTWCLIAFTIAFAVFLWFNVLLDVYARLISHLSPASTSMGLFAPTRGSYEPLPFPGEMEDDATEVDAGMELMGAVGKEGDEEGVFVGANGRGRGA